MTMKPKFWALFAFLWVLTILAALFGGFGLGVKRGIRLAEESDRASKRLEGFSTRGGEWKCLKQIWGRPLPSDLVGGLSVGGLFDESRSGTWLQSKLWEIAQSDQKIETLVPGFKNQTNPKERWFKARAFHLLPLWAQGQDEIRSITCPHEYAKAPLWDLYLTNPEEAWRRGVDTQGLGGR